MIQIIVNVFTLNNMNLFLEMFVYYNILHLIDGENYIFL